jgi:hypothetical protein
LSLVAVWGPRLSKHPGVINLNDQVVEVSVELGTDRLRLFAGNQEIGDWSIDECEIVENGSGAFLIRAEQEELPFSPAEPQRLRDSMAGIPTDIGPGDVSTEGARIEITAQPTPTVALADDLHAFKPVEQPPPGPVTLGLFYLLVAVTAFLGLWALSTFF